MDQLIGWEIVLMKLEELREAVHVMSVGLEALGTDSSAGGSACMHMTERRIRQIIEELESKADQ